MQSAHTFRASLAKSDAFSEKTVRITAAQKRDIRAPVLKSRFKIYLVCNKNMVIS